MSQEKAQLIAPEGTFTVPGLNVAGVVTGGNFVGNKVDADFESGTMEIDYVRVYK